MELPIEIGVNIQRQEIAAAIADRAFLLGEITHILAIFMPSLIADRAALIDDGIVKARQGQLLLPGLLTAANSDLIAGLKTTGFGGTNISIIAN
ncbi:MAG: hypothetical protein Sw2LagBPW_37690 [Shewanella algae]